MVVRPVVLSLPSLDHLSQAFKEADHVLPFRNNAQRTQKLIVLRNLNRIYQYFNAAPWLIFDAALSPKHFSSSLLQALAQLDVYKLNAAKVVDKIEEACRERMKNPLQADGLVQPNQNHLQPFVTYRDVRTVRKEIEAEEQQVQRGLKRRKVDRSPLLGPVSPTESPSPTPTTSSNTRHAQRDAHSHSHSRNFEPHSSPPPSNTRHHPQRRAHPYSRTSEPPPLTPSRDTCHLHHLAHSHSSLPDIEAGRGGGRSLPDRGSSSPGIGTGRGGVLGTTSGNISELDLPNSPIDFQQSTPPVDDDFLLDQQSYRGSLPDHDSVPPNDTNMEFLTQQLQSLEKRIQESRANISGHQFIDEVPAAASWSKLAPHWLPSSKDRFRDCKFRLATYNAQRDLTRLFKADADKIALAVCNKTTKLSKEDSRLTTRIRQASDQLDKSRQKLRKLREDDIPSAIKFLTDTFQDDLDQVGRDELLDKLRAQVTKKTTSQIEQLEDDVTANSRAARDLAAEINAMQQVRDRTEALQTQLMQIEADLTWEIEVWTILETKLADNG